MKHTRRYKRKKLKSKRVRGGDIKDKWEKIGTIFIRPSTGNIFSGTGYYYFVDDIVKFFDDNIKKYISRNITPADLSNPNLLYKCKQNKYDYCGIIMPNKKKNNNPLYPQYAYFKDELDLVIALNRFCQFKHLNISAFTGLLREGTLHVSIVFEFKIPEYNTALTSPLYNPHQEEKTGEEEKTGGALSDDWYQIGDIYIRQSTGGFMSGSGLWYIINDKLMKLIENENELLRPTRRLEILKRCKENKVEDVDCGIIKPNIPDTNGNPYPQYKYCQNEPILMEEFETWYENQNPTNDQLLMISLTKYIPYFKEGTVLTKCKKIQFS